MFGVLDEDEVQDALESMPRPSKAALRNRDYRERLAADKSEAGLKKLEDQRRYNAAREKLRDPR